jgi:hypothetical protein
MKPVYPQFYFHRQRNIEIETGLPLAGRLFAAKPADEEEVSEVIMRIAEMTKADALPFDAEVFIWPVDDHDKADRVDTDNFDLMKAWADNCLIVGVRVSDRDDGKFPVDSEMARECGQEH